MVKTAVNALVVIVLYNRFLFFVCVLATGREIHNQALKRAESTETVELKGSIRKHSLFCGTVHFC